MPTHPFTTAPSTKGIVDNTSVTDTLASEAGQMVYKLLEWCAGRDYTGEAEPGENGKSYLN